jgi:hypothetical protein
MDQDTRIALCLSMLLAVVSAAGGSLARAPLLRTAVTNLKNQKEIE